MDVVLVRPARAANVAAACRALKNMGVRSLALIDPPPDLDRPEARALAYGAWDVLEAAVRAATLREAVARSTVVVGTSGRPHPGAWTPRRLAAEVDRRAGEGRLALVFGPESSGLSEEELALCHLRVHIPADPAQPSLNLAQAVLLLLYELRTGGHARPAKVEDRPRATAGEVEAALDDLRRALVGIGYLNPANPDAVLAELRALITRAAPTPREVSLWRGIARQVLWAAEQIARARGGDDNPPSREETGP